MPPPPPSSTPICTPNALSDAICAGLGHAVNNDGVVAAGFVSFDVETAVCIVDSSDDTGLSVTSLPLLIE